MVKWVQNRVAERTSWDGAALVALGVIILIAGPFAKIAAMQQSLTEHGQSGKVSNA